MEVQRQQGPEAPGGIKTWSGFADQKRVHWLGDPKRADDLERSYKGNSELMKLLVRNAYTIEGLSEAEKLNARHLILTVSETDRDCWMCRNGQKSIVDTGLCRQHNLLALETRK